MMRRLLRVGILVGSLMLLSWVGAEQGVNAEGCWTVCGAWSDCSDLMNQLMYCTSGSLDLFACGC